LITPTTNPPHNFFQYFSGIKGFMGSCGKTGCCFGIEKTGVNNKKDSSHRTAILVGYSGLVEQTTQ